MARPRSIESRIIAPGEDFWEDSWWIAIPGAAIGILVALAAFLIWLLTR